jgi:hypothetical protein
MGLNIAIVEKVKLKGRHLWLILISSLCNDMAVYQIFWIHVVSCEVQCCHNTWLLSHDILVTGCDIFIYHIYFPSAIFWHGCQPYHYTMMILISVTDAYLLVSPFQQLQYLNPYNVKHYKKQCSDLIWFEMETGVPGENH